MQYNVVSRETLIDAQKNPEKHRDLIVRVAGYSAFFNVLSRATQDDIIERTETNINKRGIKMEFIIDTVNLEEIKDAIDHMPIVGVTSNPSIVKATAPENFFDHMRKVRDIIGKDRSLHVQVISKNCDEMVNEAHRILKEIDNRVYVKILYHMKESKLSRF